MATPLFSAAPSRDSSGSAIITITAAVDLDYAVDVTLLGATVNVTDSVKAVLANDSDGKAWTLVSSVQNVQIWKRSA